MSNQGEGAKVDDPSQVELGQLRADLSIESARAAQLRRELLRNEIATADAFRKLDVARARAGDLEARLKQSEVERQSLRERVSTLEEMHGDARRHTQQLSSDIEHLRSQLTTAKSEPAQQPALSSGTQMPSTPKLSALLRRWMIGRGEAKSASRIPSIETQRDVVERSGMFDQEWYRAKYPEIAATGLAPLDHFMKFGWREGKDPAPGFSTNFYLEYGAPDGRSSGLNPLYHYVVIGRHQGRPPSADAKFVSGIDQAAVIFNEFDEVHYRTKTGLRLIKEKAVEHYLKRGWTEGADPHRHFSTQFYLRSNPDVWRAGINPYVHYILSGRREGRLPNAFPDLTADQLDQWRLIAAEFDVAFYRSKYADVAEIQAEPILHYLLEGWRLDYDPHPLFSTSHYLDSNQDVRAAGINPYVHFLAEGRREGRQSKPAGSWAARSAVKEVVALSFDPAFYLARNPDIGAAGVDPLDHFLDYGWKEGRDPVPEFSTQFYLETNSDVAAAGLNPFYHYLVAGRAEGRAAIHPGGWQALALQRLLPLDKQIEEAIKTAPEYGEILDAPALTSRLGSQSLGKVILSFSQDEYTKSVGGVQLCISLEERRASERGFTHINVHPALPIQALSRDTVGTENLLVVTCNGKRLGAARAGDFQLALVELSDRVEQSLLVVHSFLGHSVETVAQTHAILLPQRSFLWLHDFFTVCTSYTLMRSGIAYCNAPELSSSACTLCAFGMERKDHLARITKLFKLVPFELIAPSAFAADFWRERSRLRPKAIHVQPHCQLERKVGTFASAGGPARIAFLGHPSVHKGWAVFLRLLSEFGDDERYEFHHMSAGPPHDSRAIFTKASVLDDGPTAMVDALIARRIDVALLWSIWPETFSFVAHEAMCAGASILAPSVSGNIARIVDESGAGNVLENESALLAAFRSGAVADAVRDARRAPRPLSSLSFSAMTFGVLDRTSP